MFAARIHKVNFNVNIRKHSVYFAQQAAQATEQALTGWASPGRAKAVIAATEEECIEKLRQVLVKDILCWMDDADLTAFTFNVAFEKIDDDGFWSSFQAITGNSFDVHAPNAWGR